MAPRGRSRKMGTTRMDAALTAMGQMGFPTTQVRSMMNKLLREYGGIVGYPFIEDNVYSVLLEALLSDQEEEKRREAQSAEVEASTKADASDTQIVGNGTAGPSGENVGSPNSHLADTPLQTDLGDGVRGEDTCSQAVEATDGTAGGEDHLHGLSLLASCAYSLKPQGASTRRRRHCNGWIVADDWVSLPPAVNEWPTLLPDAQLRRSKRNKRSEDM